MARGDNFRGHKPEGSGRKKGQANKATHDVREAISLFVQGNVDSFGEWMMEIKDPARRCEVFLKLLAFHLPKLTHVDADIPIIRSVKDLSDDEL